MFLHTAAWQAFGEAVRGHHVVNVLFHGAASLLLAALFLRSGIPTTAALSGALLFLLHPANVEAVAWISQLKSGSALALSLAALLAWPRHPALSSAFFVLALFAKPTAAFVLPVAALFDWTREGRVRWRWVATLAVAFAAYATVEFAAHQRAGAAEAVLHGTPFVLARTVSALALRYLVMAATSSGVSAFHEPEPAYSALDPWWLASLPILGLLGWRMAIAFRRRREEVAYWVWALVSFGPVSQLFPFLYPMADRYLYFILPGLIGAALLAGREGYERLPAALAALSGRLASGLSSPQALRLWASRAATAGALVLVLAFALRSHDRARIWRSPALLVADAAAHYPHGVSANLLRAKRAAQVGDVDAAVVGVRAAVERGYNRFDQLLADPGFANVRAHPKFRGVIHEIAAGWIERLGGREEPTQLELVMIANAHVARGERVQAAEWFRRALAHGGPIDAELRARLAELGQPVPGP